MGEEIEAVITCERERAGEIKREDERAREKVREFFLWGHFLRLKRIFMKPRIVFYRLG